MLVFSFIWLDRRQVFSQHGSIFLNPSPIYVRTATANSETLQSRTGCLIRVYFVGIKYRHFCLKIMKNVKKNKKKKTLI